MNMDNPEVWLRGPLPNIPPLLQPVAHALVQSGEEVEKLMFGFPDEKLWIRPAGVASVGFHLQHLSGVLDRLFTYAQGKTLDVDQLAYLQQEGGPLSLDISGNLLVRRFKDQVQKSIIQLENTDQEIGRASCRER